jgi:prevent-host-death family protein
LTINGEGMISTPSTELKASLSEYLARVKSGEELLVTERGRPVARIVPLHGEEELSARSAEAARAGILKVGPGRLPPGFWERPRPRDESGAAVGALLDERRDGR